MMNGNIPKIFDRFQIFLLGGLFATILAMCLNYFTKTPVVLMEVYSAGEPVTLTFCGKAVDIPVWKQVGESFIRNFSINYGKPFEPGWINVVCDKAPFEPNFPMEGYPYNLQDISARIGEWRF